MNATEKDAGFFMVTFRKNKTDTWGISDSNPIYLAANSIACLAHKLNHQGGQHCSMGFL